MNSLDVVGMTSIRVDGNESVYDIGLYLQSWTGTNNAMDIEVDNITFNGSLLINSHSTNKNVKTTISKVMAPSGYINIYNSSRGISISETTVNSNYGTGIYARSTSGTIKILKSTIKSNLRAGGLMLDGPSEVTDVELINIMDSSPLGRMMYVNGPATFLRCKFIHDASMERKEPTSSTLEYRYLQMFNISTTELVKFEDCDFENLVSSASKDTYIFSRWASVASNGDDSVGNLTNIELKNSRFTFK